MVRISSNNQQLKLKFCVGIDYLTDFKLHSSFKKDVISLWKHLKNTDCMQVYAGLHTISQCHQSSCGNLYVQLLLLTISMPAP